MKKTSTILAIGSGLFLSNAQAEIESEFHVGYNSQYIFRGVDFGDDAFEYGLDFAGTCDCGLDWSAGIWGISPDNDAGGAFDGNSDELDIYAAVSKTLGGTTVSLGFNAYTFDTAADDSEVFIGVAGNVYGLDAGLTAFFGTDGTFERQILLEGNLGYSFGITNTVSGNVGVTYGVIADDGAGIYSNGNGSAYFSANFSLDIILSDEMTLSPYVSVVDGADRIGGVDEEIVAGASLSFSF